MFTRRRSLAPFVAVASLLSCSTAAFGQGVPPTFTRIADTQTAVPGGSGTFTLFADSRALEGGKVAFIAYDSASGSGVYSFQNGVLSVVADTHTGVPGTASTFTVFFDVAIDGPYAAFTAGWPGPGGGCAFAGSEGIFARRFQGGAIVAIATSLSSPQHCFHGIDVEGGVVAVAGGVNRVDLIHNHSESIMALRRIGQPLVVLDTTTPSPSGGTIVGYDQDISIRGRGLLFTEILPNTSGAVAGIYTIRNDGLGPHLVADRATPVPGGTGSFNNFAGVDWDGGEVAFVGRNAGNAAALYAGTSPSDLRVLVDTSTRVPGETANFGGISNPIAYEGGVTVFSGFWSGSRTGLFTAQGGVIRSILKKSDVLDGRVVDDPFCRQQNKEGNLLLIEVRFQDSTRGLYLVHL
ncbi:MAG: hypothetical protein HYR85_17755 [Planctomycetes bacterium]|nr:hypothetical protein [Planctomycetota bacterium]MBI3845191.1 hypothetical protein [Planctomycetota bacterium]